MRQKILISPFFFILNIRNIMKYEVIKGRIDGKVAGEIVELEQEVAESYGEEYVKLIEEEETFEDETKTVKKAKNKALTSEDGETKDE
nr:MAG TPA: hypothetical protein [Caudoviricetes sp.]DAU00939.1 MAG TPA: hypothetical protein [Caudoviricetes sp.]